jgi:hypothetical protein
MPLVRTASPREEREAEKKGGRRKQEATIPGSAPAMPSLPPRGPTGRRVTSAGQGRSATRPTGCLSDNSYHSPAGSGRGTHHHTKYSIGALSRDNKRYGAVVPEEAAHATDGIFNAALLQGAIGIAGSQGGRIRRRRRPCAAIAATSMRVAPPARQETVCQLGTRTVGEQHEIFPLASMLRRGPNRLKRSSIIGSQREHFP